MRAARELTQPLVGSSASTIIIFLPLAFLSGVTGAFFKALSLIMVSAFVISFIVAWLIVPLIAHAALGEHEATRDDKGRFGVWVDNVFRKALTAGLRRRWLPLLFVLPLAIAGYLAFTNVGSGFMPVMHEGGRILDYRTELGTSLAETDRVLREIEAILKSTPESRPGRGVPDCSSAAGSPKRTQAIFSYASSPPRGRVST